MRRLIKRLRRGRITIPKEIRDEMGLRADDVLEITLEDGKLVIEPATITRTMGTPWIKALYDQYVAGPEIRHGAPQPEIKPATDSADRKTRTRRKRR